MELIVDLSVGQVSMRSPEDLKRFAVLVAPPKDPSGGRDAALEATLVGARAGRLGPSGDVLVPVDAVRRLAAESVATQGAILDAEWESGLADMMAFAATKGWIADDGSIRAHVEWEA